LVAGEKINGQFLFYHALEATSEAADVFQVFVDFLTKPG